MMMLMELTYIGFMIPVRSIYTCAACLHMICYVHMCGPVRGCNVNVHHAHEQNQLPDSEITNLFQSALTINFPCNGLGLGLLLWCSIVFTIQLFIYSVVRHGLSPDIGMKFLPFPYNNQSRHYYYYC